MQEFNWQDHSEELKATIDKIVKRHNNFMNTDIMKLSANGDENYGKDWTSVLWWNEHTKEIEEYSDEPQELIDFYHFSKSRTKVIVRYSGEDITEQFKFNPLYRDIFDDERLKSSKQI